jgi:WD40 repeat protein/tetratricopeptide (TPR) repeat protein
MTQQPPDERAIFGIARRLDSTEARNEYLQQICGDDEALLKRVGTLLQLHDADEAFLESPAVGTIPTIDLPVTETVGTVIGRYKLLQEVGEGGFGVVYLAEQREPVRRKVALKIIKPGMDTRQVVARFEAERQALALMDHPNVAHVLDGGATESGRPYFVMELVRGMPITEYCDEAKLTTDERLRLFISVCDAVQHAHQKGIIHRDIKPSNVLVTLHGETPVPKIIDFGVAKATHQPLTEKTVFTGVGQIIGTPLYMSPEQLALSGLDVDTRSDIYSLGVLLYELLTGVPPFDKDRFRELSVDEIRRTIREEDPPRPSTRISTVAGESASTISANRKTDLAKLNQSLRGELDWIVMRAMEKDRTRRYESVNEMAKDVQRYLDDEAVEACPPSTVYRLRKLARRYKGQLATVATVAAVLLGATAVSTCLAAWALKAEGVASANLVQAKQDRADALDARAIAKEQEQLAKQQRDAAEYDLYVSNLHLARHDWSAGQGPRLSTLLDALIPEPERPDFRGWEWYYLFSQVHSERFAFPGQHGPIAWSPDGKSLATRDPIGLIKIWRMGKREPKACLKGLPGRIRSIAWSPDGKRLAAAGDRKIILIWDVVSGEKVQSLRGHRASVGGVDWNPDGVRLASAADDGTVGIWDTHSLKPVSWLRGLKSGPWLHSLAWLPDGRRLLGSSGKWDNNILIVWDTETSEKLVSRSARNAVLNPDGSRISIVTATIGDDCRIETLQTGAFTASSSHTGKFPATWSSDGKRFASSGTPIKIWDAETVTQISPILGPAAAGQIDWCPDGPFLAGACADGTVRVWDAAGNPQALTLSAGDRGALSVAFSPDGSSLLAGVQYGMLKMWDVKSAKTILSLQQPGASYNWSVTWCPDGKRFASHGTNSRSNGGVMVYDANTGEDVLSLLEDEYSPGTMAWSPDAKILAVAYYRPENRSRIHVTLWDAITGREVARSGNVGGHPDNGPHLAWSADGTRLAAGKCVWAWDSESRELHEEVVLPTWQTGSVDWSPDGKQLAVGHGAQIKIFDTTDWTLNRTLLGHSNYVGSIAWNPCVPRLASGSRDGTIRIWDTSTARELWASDVHETSDIAVAWSPDGWQLASAGSKDCKVRIWDASAAEPFLKEQETEANTQSHEAEWKAANRLARKGQIDAAIGKFKKLNTESQDLPDYRLRLPGVLFNAGRQDEAIQMLKGSVDQFPDRREYQDELAFLYERRATQLCQSGEFEEATGILQILGEEFPDRPDFRAELAFQMAKVERLEEAMSTLERLSDAFDGRPDYRPELARQLATSLYQSEAVSIYRQLVVDYPDVPEHKFRLARNLSASGAVDEAMQVLQKLVPAYPDESDYAAELARAYFRRASTWKQDESDKALLDLDEAIRLDPEFGEALGRRATIHLERGDFDNAIPDLSQRVDIESGTTKAIADYWMALACLGTGETDRYRATCSDVVEHFGNSQTPEEAHWTAWTCLLAPEAVENYARVVQLAEQAVVADPKSHSYLKTLGGILYRACRCEEAVQRLTEADKLAESADPASKSSPAYTWYFLAMAHHKLGHDAEARTWLAKANEWTEKVLREHEDGTAALPWNRKLTLKLFREEAETLLGVGASGSSEKPDETAESVTTGKPAS